MLKNLYNTTIEGLHFHTQNPTFGSAIALGSFNDQVLIRDNSFDTNAINPTSDNVSAIYGYSVQNRSLRVEDNTIQDVAFGVYLYGYSNSTGYEIKGNTITNAHTGLYANQIGAVDIWNNDVSARDRALHLASTNTARIRGNQMVTSGGEYVLYHNSSTLTTGTQEIYNNYLRGVSNQDAIFLSRVQNARIYHNTIINESASTASKGFNHTAQNSGLDFRNNIVMANAGTAARFNSTNDITALAANIYYSTSGAPVMLNTTPIADLATYQGTFGDISSMYSYPLLDDASFVLQIGSPAINAGVTLAEVPFDINGTLRELPDIGCYEYIDPALIIPQNVRIVQSEGYYSLVWDEVPGAASYIVYCGSSPDAASWQAIPVQNTYIFLDMEPSATFFKVSAVNE